MIAWCSTRVMNTHYRKDSFFSKWFWRKLLRHKQNHELGHLHHPLLQIYSKWIKNLTLKPVTVKLLKENKSHSKIWTGEWYLAFTWPPKNRQQKQIQANRIPPGQKLLKSKENDWENEETLRVFANPLSAREFTPQTHRKFTLSSNWQTSKL